MILKVFLFFVGAFLAQVLSQAPPRRCCTRERWEGYFGITEGYAINRRTSLNVAKVIAFYSYDGTKRRFAMKETVEGGGNFTQRFRVIADYRKRKMYSIDENSGSCYYLPLDTPFVPACIPEGAKYLGSSYHGGPKDKLAYNAWSFGVRAANMSLKGTFTITKRDCFPVGEEYYGTVAQSGNTVSLVMALGFGGITYGIKDPAIFKPPRDCSPATFDQERIIVKHPLFKYARAKVNLGTLQPSPNAIPMVNLP